MASDVTQAFGHPELRSRATGSDLMADRISLRDHIVTVEIGAFQQERGTTQRVCFNLVVEVAPHQGASNDDVDQILSYDTLTEAIAAELAAERLNLLETLAERIALRVLRDPKAQRCFVRIEKLDRGPGALGVEIVRDQSSVAQTSSDTLTHSAAVVVYISPIAQSHNNLQGWISQLADMDVPAVICVDLPKGSQPSTPNAQAQRRIDLLAIEQNAWVLAGLDARCVVVQTRTELDWAMKNGALTVWAPSKMVLDSVDRPAVRRGQGPELAAWLAAQVSASRLIVVGATPPKLDGIAVVAHDPTDPVLSTA